MYVLLELLLRPPFGVGILLPTLGPEVPDFDAAGPFPVVETNAQDTEPHEKRKSYLQVDCRPTVTENGREHTLGLKCTWQWDRKTQDAWHRRPSVQRPNSRNVAAATMNVAEMNLT